MDYRGLIWVAGDEIATAIEATVTIGNSGDFSIVSKDGSLGSWPIDQVVVEPRGESGGESDFLLIVGSDRIMFRTFARTGNLSFDMATAGPSGLSDRIRASAGQSSESHLLADKAAHPPQPTSLTNSEKPGGWWRGLSTVRRLIVIMLGLLVLIVMATLDDDSAPAPALAPAPTLSVSAGELFEAYDSNEVAADQRYGGRLIEITGVVDSIGKDILDKPYVTLEAPGRLFGIQCMFEKQQESTLARLVSGQEVTLTGRPSSYLGNVLVRDCTVQR